MDEILDRIKVESKYRVKRGFVQKEISGSEVIALLQDYQEKISRLKTKTARFLRNIPVIELEVILSEYDPIFLYQDNSLTIRTIWGNIHIDEVNGGENPDG